ncbi:Putative P-loop containing nucleoside triphosphate hydrolase [Septoria linicola]|uniref:P-loop containing nucleoside triphosphate hydrolase n=1 Tax=Septoria linicola TaxID=215465 RepID=A0A9Q9B2A4_9PEZI|nr:Putative P-loop containing nucleoside triphosphate hydrolase [Septoria linicola]
MSNFRGVGSVLGKRERDVEYNNSQVGVGLFVTGQTPTPAPDTQRLTASSSYAFGGTYNEPHNYDEDDEDDEDDGEEDGFTGVTDEDDDTDEGGIYSQDQEEFPPAAAYDSKITRGVECAQSLAEQLQQVLQPYVYVSADIATMADKAGEACVKPGAKKQLIMLLGHTGTGKSSTTNSFVDDLDASKAAATGESCTCVPTLITSGLQGQSMKYAAEIRIFNETTRHAFLLEHIKNYIRYIFEKDPTWSEEQEYDYRSHCETALKVLRALFCDKFEFESPGSIQVHLAAHRDDALPQLIGTLEIWCQDLLAGADHTEAQPLLRFDADTAAELNQSLEPHTFESGSFESPALWPLIEHVRKGVHGSRILRYADFLDLPGTFDTNRVRAEFAHKFIKDADALWTVTGIERPLSDAELDRTLATYADRFGNNVAIITTRSDANIDDGLAKAMREKKQSVGDYWEQSKKIKTLTKKLGATEKKLKAMRGHQKRQRTMSSAQETKLRDEKDELETMLEEARNTQMTELVDVRNNYITLRLKEDKRKHLALGTELSVFCVSNTHYSVHKGVNNEDSRLMSVDATQIPALRSHALQMAASREFNNTEDYVDKVLTLLKGAMLWTDTAPTQKHAAIDDIAKQPGALLDAIIDNFLEFAADKCDSGLIFPMTNKRLKYETAAVRYKQTLNQAGGWHHSTVRAFFAQDGNHATKAREREAWNERFMDEQTATVEGAWRNLLVQQKAALRAGVDKVVKALEDIPGQILCSNAGTPVALAALNGVVITCRNRIRTAHDTRIEELDKKMSNLKLSTTRDVPSGYFTNAMRGMYEVCKGLSGDGCTRRMLDTLENWLSGKPPQYGVFNSPFAAVTSSLQTEFSEAITTTTILLQKDIKTILQEMTQHFERALQGQVNNSAEMAARGAIRPALQNLKPEIEALEAMLEAVKLQYGITRE